MSFVPRHHRYTYADYVGIETYSETKHEFLDGEIYAMLGGTRDHSALAGSMIRLLGNAVGDRPCAVHTSDLRIYVEAVGLATYPDASVVCEPFQEFAAGPKSTALTPMILVEVTSDSSEQYDSGATL